MDLARMRHEYEANGINEADFGLDPLPSFQRWMQVAVDSGVREPNAMVVATADATGQPWSRFVLLKQAGPEGFDFYTNYESNKSNDLSVNPRASLTFGWLELRRQIMIAGTVAQVPATDADDYWAVRPRGSQLGGWASDQSRPLSNRAELEARYQEAAARFDDSVPRPEHWGGWRVIPHTIEFWQGRLNRLHDRLRYVNTAGQWTRSRLAP